MSLLSRISEDCSKLKLISSLSWLQTASDVSQFNLRVAGPFASTPHAPKSHPLAALIFQFLTSLLFLTQAKADVAIAQLGVHGIANSMIYDIRISGEITRATAAQFARAVKDPRIEKTRVYFFSPLVYLNSPGGDVIQAIKIGRALRQANLATMVLNNEVCASACVLILAAGVSRSVGSGYVGIHRPHFDEVYFSKLSAESARAKYSELSDSVQRYLQQMGMTPSLYADMLKISSDDIMKLSQDEMLQYGLIGEDPAWAEYQRAKSIATEGSSQYEVNRGFFNVLSACINGGSRSADQCDSDVRTIFFQLVEECTNANHNAATCAKSVEGLMMARFAKAQ